MSEFQKFVTYINLYEENSKIRSLGFAKIEKRGEQCKMEIHMRGTGYTGISCPVYLFVRRDRQMEGISLGKIQIMNGVGDGRFFMDGTNINKSGYNLEEIGGFLIFVNEKVMFASQWDDQEIIREHFYLPEKETGNKMENAGNKQLANPDIPLENKDQENTSSSPENYEHTNTLDDAEHTPMTQESNSEGINDSFSTAENIANNQSVNRTNHAKRPVIKATEAAAQRARQSIQAIQEQPWEQKWQFILENYPVLTPFEGEEEILCIHLELKDLRLLPKRYWYLGNNSFLLHGFFNYRYLILGTMKKGEKREWFIGVPGVFQSQEKVMAAIFGFPEYKSEKACTQKTGQFGYWYRFMDL